MMMAKKIVMIKYQLVIKNGFNINQHEYSNNKRVNGKK